MFAPNSTQLFQDSDSWHSSSCRIPSSSYTYSIQQQERYLQQQIQQQTRTYLYKKQPELAHLPNSERPLPLPIIQVTRENRRTSISSPLRFTRTVSSDSIDSLERRCIQELKVQRIMETERPRLLSQNSMVVERQQQMVKRQLSCNPPSTLVVSYFCIFFRDQTLISKRSVFLKGLEVSDK
jgi:hypothetical protein